MPISGKKQPKETVATKPGQRPSQRRKSAVVLRRALWAGIADRIQHFGDHDRGSLRRDPGRRISAGDVEGALTRMRIGAVLHPTMLLALADGAGLQQHGDRPSPTVRIASRGFFISNILASHG